jgi:TetR/AcrR family transcriptional regulator, transcriptional repressor of bet genes
MARSRQVGREEVMPRQGMKAARRAALVEAAIATIGEAGTIDVTVNAIARRAGVSSALAHHYFGSKERIMFAAMRHILRVFGAQVRTALATAKTPAERLEAIIRASFDQENFRRDVVSAWLNFYVMAMTSPSAQRLLVIYQRRLRSNLVHELRQIVGGDRAESAAQIVAAMIDGLYIREALNQKSTEPTSARDLALACIDAYIRPGAGKRH